MLETKVSLVATKEIIFCAQISTLLCFFVQLQFIITVSTVILPGMFALTGYLYYLSISNGNACLNHIPGTGPWASYSAIYFQYIIKVNHNFAVTAHLVKLY